MKFLILHVVRTTLTVLGRPAAQCIVHLYMDRQFNNHRAMTEEPREPKNFDYPSNFISLARTSERAQLPGSIGAYLEWMGEVMPYSTNRSAALRFRRPARR